MVHSSAITSLALISVLLIACAARGDVASSDHTNIVFILVDDVAWSDLGCYGSAIHETPHIDRLASEGMRFTQAYAPAPICSASRAAIMTGKFPARLNFEFVTKNSAGQQQLDVPLRSPPYTLDLPLNQRTLAEALSPGGYATGFFGKWHISRHHEGYLGWSPTHGPMQQGFAVGSSDFGSHPYSYRKNKTIGGQPVAMGTFPVDTLTERATDFIGDHRDQPFFLYLSHYYAHDPIHSRCDWLVQKYRSRLPERSPDPSAAYGAMIETLDHLIGELLSSLEEFGVAERTIVVLTSDNGGHPGYTTNAPLRGSKWNLYEGGIRVPLIVKWPGRVQPGSRCDSVVHGCDLLPTFCEVAGLPYDPKELDGISLVPLLKDPTVVLPRARPLVWHFPYYHPEKQFHRSRKEIGVGDYAISQTRPHSAIRREKWKLLHFYEDDRVELYNLASDLGEQHNLAGENLSLARRMKIELSESLSSMNARMPIPDAEFVDDELPHKEANHE